MFCSCTNNPAFEILVQETPTKTWREKIINAHIYITTWRVAGAFIPFLCPCFCGCFLLGRRYGTTGSLMFYPWCFSCFLLSTPRFLRVHSTDRPETLPPDRNLAEFYNASPNIRGHSPKIIRGPKTCKIWVDFGPLHTLIAISGTGQHIQNRKTLQTTAIPPAFDEKSPVNFGPQTKKVLLARIEPIKWIFRERLHFGP